MAMAESVIVCVAPHAGAWIETLISNDRYTLENVAPHAGAWIETLVARLAVMAA